MFAPPTKFIRYSTLFVFTLLLIPRALHAQNDPPLLPAWEANNIRVLTLLLHERPVAEAYFSPGGSVFLSGTVDGQLYVWQADDDPRWQRGELRFQLAGYVPGMPNAAFNSDESRMAASLGADGSLIEVRDMADGELVASFENHAQAVKFIAFIGDDNQVVSWDFNDEVYIWNAQDGDAADHYEDIASLAISPNGQAIALAHRDGGLIVHQGDSSREFPDIHADNLSFSPGGRWLAIWGNGLTVWDLRRRMTHFEIDDADVDDVIWTPDGRFVIAQRLDTAGVYAITANNAEEIAAGDVVFEFPSFSQNGGLRHLVLSPDGQRAVTIDYRGIGRLWRFDENGEIRQIGSLSGLLDAALISPDGQTLVGFRRDFRARFWQPSSGNLRGEASLPESVIFSPDWRLIASYTNNVVAWRGVPSEERVFDFPAIGRPRGRTNLRPTPEEILPRIAELTAQQSLFATARTADGQWLYLVLEDGTTGWANAAPLFIEAPDDYFAALPVIETARTLPQNLEDDTPFLMMPEPAPIDTNAGLEGCASGRVVIVLERQETNEVSFFLVDCGTVTGWLPEENLDFGND